MRMVLNGCLSVLFDDAAVLFHRFACFERPQRRAGDLRIIFVLLFTSSHPRCSC